MGECGGFVGVKEGIVGVKVRWEGEGVGGVGVGEGAREGVLEGIRVRKEGEGVGTVGKDVGEVGDREGVEVGHRVT